MTVEAYQSNTMRLAREELGACTLIEDLLPLYIEGEVSPSSRDLIVEHLARCERCAGFLAGAQSVRVQLRRDGAQHAAVITNKLPERHAVGRGQWLAVMLAVLACCAIGGVGSVLAWHGHPWGVSLQTLVGGAAVLIAFFLLMALASMRAPLLLRRVITLTIGCGVGSLGLMLFAGGGEPGKIFFGMLLACLGFIGVWSAVWSGKARGR